MNFIAGRLKEVDADLKAAGYDAIGNNDYRKGDDIVRWIHAPEHLQGARGGGRTFILRSPFDEDMRRMAQTRGFTVTRDIP